MKLLPALATYRGLIALLCAAALGTTAGAPVQADAQTSAGNAKLVAPAGSSDVAAPRAERRMLTRDQLSEYQNLLLEPLAHWVEEGDFLSKIAPHLEFAWELTPKWEEGTNRNADQYKLGPTGELQGSSGGALPFGMPFPYSSQVQTEQDPGKKAYKILWNALATQSSAQRIAYDLTFTWVGVQSVMRSARGLLYREWTAAPDAALKDGLASDGIEEKSELAEPADAPPVDAAPQSAALPATGPSEGTPKLIAQPVWSEKEALQLHTPSVVLGFAEIMWRTTGLGEDRFWIHSPVIGKTRELHPANRDDPFLDGILSVEDLFVFSGKLQVVDPKVVAEREMLVGFASLEPILVEENSGPVKSAAAVERNLLANGLPPAVQAAPGSPGVSSAGLRPDAVSSQAPEFLSAATAKGLATARGTFRRNDGSTSSVQWNHETQTFTNFPLWNSTSSVLVPRKVWILELWPLSPFAVWGKILLVVDQETFLPVYKLVYDQTGKLQRVVIGGWSLARSKDSAVVFPFCAYVTAIKADGTEAVTVSTDAAGVFPSRSTEPSKSVRPRFENLLDIEHFEKAEKDSAGKDSVSKDGKAPAEAKPVDPSLKLPAATPDAPDSPESADPESAPIERDPSVADRPNPAAGVNLPESAGTPSSGNRFDRIPVDPRTIQLPPNAADRPTADRPTAGMPPAQMPSGEVSPAQAQRRRALLDEPPQD